MIPVQLTIQGLYSYQEKQNIDFTQLTAAHLFGIFGTVGSGKSSILEAITFAIYGRSDRLNLSGDNRYYNMMNLKSNELLIDFIFETGKEQTAYRATVKGRRNGRNFEDVKTLERLAYQKKGNGWQPIEPEALEHAIGLSYDNFKRTIIIPQGQFQEFLQLGNKDRTQMMKELFNLGRYEFYYQTASLESRNNARKQNLEGQLQQLGDIGPEQLDEFRNRLEKLAIELKELNNKLAGCQQEEEQFRLLQELTGKRTVAEIEYKKLQEQVPGFQALEKKIFRYEQCVVQFKHLLDLLQLNIQKQKDREKQISSDLDRLKAEEEEIMRLGKMLEVLKPAFEKREELKQKAGELARLLRMKDLEKEAIKEEDRLKNGTRVCDETVRKLEKQKAEKHQMEEWIRVGRNAIPDLSLLSDIKTWHSEKHNLDKQIQETEKEIEKSLEEEKTIRQAVLKIWTEPLFAGFTPEEDWKACDFYLQNRVSKIRENLRVLDEQADHIRVKAQLQAYAEKLEEGMPCPLCGSLHHPELFKTDEIREAQERVENERQACQSEIEQIAEFSRQLNLLDSQLQFIHRYLKDLNDRKSDQKERAAAHAERFIWDKYRKEAELTEAFREADRIQAEIKQQERISAILDNQIRLDEKNKERYQAEVEKLKISLTANRTEMKTIKDQLRFIDHEQYMQVPADLVEAEKAGLLQEYERIGKDYAEKSDLFAKRAQQKDTLAGSLLANQRELEQDQLNFEKLNNQLDKQLERSSFQTKEEISMILSESMDLEGEKQKLADFREGLLRVKTLLEQLQQEIGLRIYDPELHQKMVTEITLLQEQVAEKNREQGKTAELFKKLENDLENQASLRKELEQLESRAENLRTMKSLFKASGFVNYISSVYLQNLCNAANDRFFRLTRQKLSLEISPDNSFQVRDFLNGGKVRSIKTLSGGQTFQAALSLALALADNIQKITESNQNFFFLDEGFGSLDKESLAVVFDTLKTLRKENRIVGVISHVEEMQQEIGVHLHIENDENRGSLICKSWNK